MRFILRFFAFLFSAGAVLFCSIPITYFSLIVIFFLPGAVFLALAAVKRR